MTWTRLDTVWDDDKTVGTELFSRIGTDRYIKTTGDNGETIYLRNNLNDDYESLYKLGNLKINPEAAQNVGKIPLSTVQGSKILTEPRNLDIWDEKFASLTRTCMRSRITCHSTIIILVNMPLWVRHFIIYVGNQTTMVDGYDNQETTVRGGYPLMKS